MSKYELTMGKDLDLKAEQERTEQTPVLRANVILKMLYIGMDILYGKKGSLPKFRTIEVLARYPYWAWENGAYMALTKLFATTKSPSKEEADIELHVVDLGRKSQDNEQWHMLMIDDIMTKRGEQPGWLFGAFLPRVMALKYYYITRVMYWLNPAWSFAMNAKFESHAEHEYMKIVRDHPEWEDEPVDTVYFDYYPRQKSMADLFRRIGLDERDHMHESMTEYERLTGRELK